MSKRLQFCFVIGQDIDPSVILDVQPPIRRPRNSLVHTRGELERAVELAALKARPRGGVFVLLDSDDDCPAELPPALLRRAETAALGLRVSVILAHREFDGWFIAAAESLRGRRGLSADLARPQNPEAIRGAKGWLCDRKRDHVYSETIDQPAFAAMIDLEQARTAKSFDKCYRDLSVLIEELRSC